MILKPSSIQGLSTQGASPGSGIQKAKEEWFSIQHNLGGPVVVRQMAVPQPRHDEVVVLILGCAICRADCRVARGSKETRGNLPGTQAGHEGFGLVVACADGEEALLGEMVSIMPHVRELGHQCESCQNHKEHQCSASSHMGWDVHGVIGQYAVVPSRNITPISAKVVQQVKAVEESTGVPWQAIMSQIEPLSCVLTSVEKIYEMDRENPLSNLIARLQNQQARRF